ncbi:hypothetical protein F5884DRAFT_858201 [Xylogone sp. PMI_703]|nr:hypothetical protein F5884DRAFT_858201 [Xylogone sp. PMI_703]
MALVQRVGLSQSSPSGRRTPGVFKSSCALADYGNVPHFALHHRVRRRSSVEAKPQDQQHLEPYKEGVAIEVFVIYVRPWTTDTNEFYPFNSLQCHPPAPRDGQTA